MRIIKNFALNSNFSINCMAISNDSKYIALGDSNKIITVFLYNQMDMVIKRCVNPFNTDENLKGKFLLYPEGGNLSKLVLDYHNDSINAIVFTKLNKHYLISGASDKHIIIWRIIEEGFSYEKVRILTNQSDVTDLAITPNDEFIFTASVDNNIYIWRTNFSSNTFELVNCINNIHNNFITSICLDPKLDKITLSELNNFIFSTGIKFASYSDDGKLVLSETIPSSQGFRTNIIKEYTEFINLKNKINSIQKKIDWSSDGNWIVSVNHHYIKNHKVVHARLINLNDISTSQVLIGHECAILVAKFSPSKYTNKEGESFSLLATSDTNGNLILWKIENTQFKVLVEISSFSESNITYLLWSLDGNYLFASNSNGSVYIVEFNEYFKTMPYSQQTNEVMNKIVSTNNITSSINIRQDNKKRITPDMLNSKTNNILPTNTNGNSNFLNNPPSTNNINAIMPTEFIFNPNQQIQECLRCQRQKFDSLETKIVRIKLESFGAYNVYFQWENKVYDNYCTVQIRMKDNHILYANRFIKKLIRLFSCNNYFYVLYDTNGLLSIYTLFNVMIFNNLYVEDITFMEIFTHYLLFITSENKITLIDVNKKEKVFETLLNINSSSTSSISTKISSVKFLDLDRIIIYADSFNVFKNSNVKNLLVYNRNLNVLTQLDDNAELESIIMNVSQEQKTLKSQYNYILDDRKFYSLLEQYNLIADNDDKALNDNIKIHDEIKSLEEKILFNHILNQKNEFVFFLKKYLNDLVKNKLFYKLMDFFIFNFKFNENKMFLILQEKKQEVMSNLIKESITNSELIPEDVKDFIIKVTSI